MSTASNGRAREHRVMARFEAASWLIVMRSAGSKGAADFIAVHPFFGLAFVQVGTANKALGPADRDRFVTIAEACSALPLLATARPGKPPLVHVVTRDVPSRWERWRQLDPGMDIYPLDPDSTESGSSL